MYKFIKTYDIKKMRSIIQTFLKNEKGRNITFNYGHSWLTQSDWNVKIRGRYLVLNFEWSEFEFIPEYLVYDTTFSLKPFLFIKLSGAPDIFSSLDPSEEYAKYANGKILSSSTYDEGGYYKNDGSNQFVRFNIDVDRLVWRYKSGSITMHYFVIPARTIPYEPLPDEHLFRKALLSYLKS